MSIEDEFEIEIPEGLPAVLNVLGQRFELASGMNRLMVEKLQ